jgi:hypothetical protein
MDTLSAQRLIRQLEDQLAAANQHILELEARMRALQVVEVQLPAVPLPTFDAARDACIAGGQTPIEQFIWDNETKRGWFRAQLVNALNHAVQQGVSYAHD